MFNMRDHRIGRHWISTALIVLGMLFVLVASQTGTGGLGTSVASGSSTVAGISPEGVISTSWHHTCGVRFDGSIDCWGQNDDGEGEDPAGPFRQVSAGVHHSCGLKLDGGIDCWGDNDAGRAEDQSGPFTQVSAGLDHTCGLKPDGSVDCWGDNWAGQAEDQAGPFIQVSAGRSHACGLKPDGNVTCWGYISENKAGPFSQISAGYIHNCGLKLDGSIDCWGDNDFGQSEDRTGPFIQVSARVDHSCGLKAGGSVECWGDNGYGQAEDQTGPFLQVSAGSIHTCGLKPDQSVACWGGNPFGQADDQDGPFGPEITEGGRLDYTIQQFSDGTWYNGIYLTDMDYDGVNEVLIGNRNTNAVEIWRYDPGLDTLVLLDNVEFSNHVHDLKAADFDRDGDMDLAVGLRFDGLYYAMNTGMPGTVGSWSIREIDGLYSLQVLVDDFDKDGHLDIFHGVDYGPINTWYGDGAGNFTAGVPVLDTATGMRVPRSFDAFDLDGDGRLDLIGTDGSFMRAFLNPGNRAGSWTSTGPFAAVGDYPCCDSDWLLADVSPSAGDLDGNGVIDQVAQLQRRPSGTVDVIIFEGSVFGGNLAWAPVVLDTVNAIGSAGHTGVADMDGDGYLDVHFGGAEQFNGLRVYLGDGSGGFSLQTILLDHGLGGVNSFSVGDLNGDGSPDIVAARHTDNGGEYAGFEVLFGLRQERSILLPLILRS